MDSEIAYLETYFKSPDSMINLLFQNDNVVGYASAIPLEQETPEIKKPFIDAGLPLKDYFYIGETMLQKPMQGLKFFRQWKDFGTQKVKARGFKYFTAMTVERPENHPSKPKNYLPLDSIWQHYGGVKNDSLKAVVPWK